MIPSPPPPPKKKKKKNMYITHNVPIIHNSVATFASFSAFIVIHVEQNELWQVCNNAFFLHRV